MARREGPADTLPGATTLSLAGAEPSPSATSASEPAPRIELVVLEGPDAGVRLQAHRPRVLVGTHAACDLVLSDGAVSRFHLELAPDASGRIVVRDLDSHNGTRLDGVAVLVAPITENQVINIGATRVRYGVANAPLDVPLARRDRFGLMVGRSLAMARVFATLERAAASDATVLLLGETGTGKEAAAESVHRESARASGPFIVVDCGALPPNLLESELFGHEKGAFTGADTRREGAFEAAAGGTIFLDEIGELPLAMQPKLLRVLERREVKSLGKNKHVKVDVRVIAATHRDLRTEVNAQRFRSDLYFRLAVLEVVLPPLRGRPDDLPLLIEMMLNAMDAAPEQRKAVTCDAFVSELARHAWPGNVRELRNYLERYLALEDLSETLRPVMPISTSDGSSELDLSRPLKELREKWMRPLEQRYLESLIARHRGNLTAVARAAGIDRITLYRLLWKHGLRTKEQE